LRRAPCFEPPISTRQAPRDAGPEVKGRASTDGLPCSLACEALLKQVLPAVITDDGTGAPATVTGAGVAHRHTALGCSIGTGVPATVTGADDRRHGIRPDNPSDAPPDAAGCLADAADDTSYTPPDATDDASYALADATDDASGCPPDAADDTSNTPPDAAEDISGCGLC
jgi:hypothetical protein